MLRYSHKKLIFLWLALTIGAAIVLTVLISFFPSVLRVSDLQVSAEVQEPRAISLLPIMTFISLFGDNGIVALSVLVMSVSLFIFNYRREAVFTILTLLADGATKIIKISIDRNRPTSDLITVYQHLNDPSFPSGHVVHYVVFFGWLFVLIWIVKNIPTWVRLGVSFLCLSLITSISLARIFLGAHWATDVLAGYLFGASFLTLLLWGYFRKK